MVGTIVTASVLAASAAGDNPDALRVGAYALATIVVFWIAHGWARSLGARSVGDPRHRLAHGLRHELPVLESVVPPLLALGIASAAGDSDENAITIAAWVCVGELGFFGGEVAHAEGASAPRIALTAAACASLGATMIALKAIVK